jgi:hypothetical protein
MPSSHSALCSSVTTAIAMQQGLGSPLFAVAACFRCARSTASDIDQAQPQICEPWGQLQASGALPGLLTSPHLTFCDGGDSADRSAITTTTLPTHCSVIVMYDAMGVRRHAGLQAELLNVVVGEVRLGEMCILV